MSELTKRWEEALRAVETLSPEEQDSLAEFIIEDVEDRLEGNEDPECELCAWLDDLQRWWGPTLPSPLDGDPVAPWD